MQMLMLQPLRAQGDLAQVAVPGERGCHGVRQCARAQIEETVFAAALLTPHARLRVVLLVVVRVGSLPPLAPLLALHVAAAYVLLQPRHLLRQRRAVALAAEVHGGRPEVREEMVLQSTTGRC